MRESIKVIKCCSLISAVFLILTYAVTVNSETHFIRFDSVWLSNNFFTTLFGGVFASMLVVVLCEIHTNLNLKMYQESIVYK